MWLRYWISVSWHCEGCITFSSARIPGPFFMDFEPPEHEGNMLIQNGRNHLIIDIASHPKRPK
jgi:hypothetical protein